MTKQCIKCRIEKELENNFNRYSPNKYLNICKLCNLQSTNESRRKRILKKKSLLLVVDPNYKKCTKCNQVLDLISGFYKRKDGSDRYRSACKKCEILGDTIYRRNKRLNLHPVPPPRKRKYKDAQERTRNRALREKYGLTIHTYQELWDEQNGKCFICHNEEKNVINGKIVPLSVDHCHITGQIRKLLCNRCNTSLGKVNEDPTILLSMINYLEVHNDNYKVPVGWC